MVRVQCHSLARIFGSSLMMLLTVGAMVLYTTSHAQANTCTASNNQCRAWTNTYGQDQITTTISGYYSEWFQTIFTAYRYSGTGDNERYGVFDMYLTQNPDQMDGEDIFVAPGPDSSSAGDQSTMETRVWSSANRPDQINYAPLESDDGNSCDTRGSNMTTMDSAQVTVPPLSVTIGWSSTEPIYTDCTRIAPSDQYSHYINFTLQDTDPTISTAQISQDFVSAQVMPNNYPPFYTMAIGYSAFGQFGCGGCDIVATGNKLRYYTWE